MSNQKTVGIGLVGCGFMGLAHLQGYLKNDKARIAAICDAVRLPEDGDFSHVAGNVDVGDAGISFSNALSAGSAGNVLVYQWINR